MFTHDSHGILANQPAPIVRAANMTIALFDKLDMPALDPNAIVVMLAALVDERVVLMPIAFEHVRGETSTDTRFTAMLQQSHADLLEKYRDGVREGFILWVQGGEDFCLVAVVKVKINARGGEA